MNGHLLRGERRAVERKLGCLKTLFVRRLHYPLFVLGLVVLVALGLHQG